MDALLTYIIYFIAAILLAVSFYTDRRKTMLSLKKAWKMFLSVLPQFLAIILLVGIFLVVLDQETIQKLIGSGSGFGGMLLSSTIGAITLVPVIIAFPIASELLNNGAGIAQIAVFISTLTTVGFVTLPLESKILGKKVAVLRNILFFAFSFVTAYIAQWVLT